MKFTKRILATLLTFALALGLALPAFAEEFDLQTLTKEKLRIDAPEDYTVKVGEPFTLSLELLVDLPADVEVRYQWRYGVTGVIYEGATEASFTVSPGMERYPEGSDPFDRPWGQWSCRVTFVRGTQTREFLMTKNVRLEALWKLTRRPENQSIAYGQEILLEAAAEGPEEITTKFWWTNAAGKVIAEGQELRLAAESPYYPKAKKAYESATGQYAFHIAFYETNEQGEPMEINRYDARACTVKVGPERGRNAWEKIQLVPQAILGGIGLILFFPIALFVFPPFPGLIIFLLPLVPFILLAEGVKSLAKGVKGLFSK